MSLLSAVLKVHDRVYKGTGGRVGHRILGVPTLMLRTKGRRSGEMRTTSLVYAQDGSDYLVVASNGGSDVAPAWLHNLTADPSVEVQVGRETKSATARVVFPGDPDYDRVWKVVNDNNGDRYSAYQKQTDRPIPVVALTPGG